MMKLQRKGPPSGRVEYHWRVDREQGFEGARFIYDAQGRLAAVDYELGSKSRPQRTPPTPAAPSN